ncbi:unnamed protein product [Polarella glacialis]|uniref:RCC1-like domain-containing protein n=1 Tax=Polarella glacialis TaxID=89957 RepID=A0A813IUF9_POLGL|nr:unnamed protein product [Polarella glacialis]
MAGEFAAAGATGNNMGSDEHLEGQIYTWGFCTHGQLGLKEQILGAREYIEVPTHCGVGSVLSDIEVKAAACGHFHTLVVDSRGNLYSFGRNDRGQLGRGDDCEGTEKPGAVPRRLKILSTSIISDVTCGAFHCLAVTVDGALLSWGWNKSGQLGRRTSYQSDAEPGFVAILEAKNAAGMLRSVAAGLGHSAAVLSTGQVFTWGSNAHGQLGVGHVVQPPNVAEFPVFVNDVVGTQVAAGDNHLLVLTADGLVVAAGDSTYFQLGAGAFDSVEAKTGRFVQVTGLPMLEDLSGGSMTSVAAGGTTSAAISAQGELFAWGGGAWGQLGQGDREDRAVPGSVRGLPFVVSVHIAQDHVLALCADRAGEDDEQNVLLATTIWGWGRRKLLPRGVGMARGVDHFEAQCFAAQVPAAQFFGGRQLGVSAGPNNNRLGVQATCGGSHSLVFLALHDAKWQPRKDVAAWCPRTSTVTGPGIKGGRVSEPISFRIISRNEDGRDEKMGGLRFCIWATHVDSPARSSSSNSSSAFELRSLRDCCDGGYDGAYGINRPGKYLLHVHMLPPGQEASTAELGDISRGQARGERLLGSPFRVAVDSGPAFGFNCQLRLRRGGVSKVEVSEGGQDEAGENMAPLFRVQACADVVWDILAFDVLGHPGTLKSDRFVATVRLEEKAPKTHDLEPVEEHEDLATSMGFPGVPSGLSSGASAVRERVRQRAAERAWQRASSMSNFYSAGGSSAPSAAEQVGHLQVKMTKDLGRREVHWTPSRVGSYLLSVGALGPGESPGAGHAKGSPVGQSPFKVQVVAGNPVAGQSQLLVGESARTRHETPRALADEPPRAEIPVRLVLRDRAGNDITENLDPLKHVILRVEGASIVGDDSEEYGAELLEWSVRTCSSVVSLSVTASPQLREAARDRAARNFQTTSICFFVSATDRVSRDRLVGSPWLVQLAMPTPRVLEPELDSDSAKSAGLGQCALGEADVTEELPEELQAETKTTIITTTTLAPSELHSPQGMESEPRELPEQREELQPEQQQQQQQQQERQQQEQQQHQPQQDQDQKYDGLQPGTQPEAQQQPEIAPELQSEPQLQPQLETQLQPQTPDLQAEPQLLPQLETQPQVQPQPEPQTHSESQPAMQTQQQPDENNNNNNERASSGSTQAAEPVGAVALEPLWEPQATCTYTEAVPLRAEAFCPPEQLCNRIGQLEQEKTQQELETLESLAFYSLAESRESDAGVAGYATQISTTLELHPLQHVAADVMDASPLATSSATMPLQRQRIASSTLRDDAAPDVPGTPRRSPATPAAQKAQEELQHPPAPQPSQAFVEERPLAWLPAAGLASPHRRPSPSTTSTTSTLSPSIGGGGGGGREEVLPSPKSAAKAALPMPMRRRPLMAAGMASLSRRSDSSLALPSPWPKTSN